MLEAFGLTKKFGSFQAVSDVSLKVEPGEVLGFLGPNGAGKSTTMRMLTGVLPADGGEVKIDGISMEQQPLLAKSRLGYLPENAPLYAEMTVVAFLWFCAEMRNLRGEEGKKAVAHAMELCQLGEVRHQPVDTLSKGFRHRLCFAQAILSDPPNLILDEPTDGLDPNQKNTMRQLIREMGKKKAIIVSTHILEEVDAICTRIAILDRGKLLFDGDLKTLRRQYGEAHRRSADGLTLDEIFRGMTCQEECR